MESIGVREIRRNVSEYLRRVEAGEAFEVTDRGRPVAILTGTPEGLRSGVAEIIDRLVASGVYGSVDEALAAGVEALIAHLHKNLVDEAFVEGYQRIPPEPDPWVDEAAQRALTAMDPW